MRNLVEHPITDAEIIEYLERLGKEVLSEERIGDMGPLLLQAAADIVRNRLSRDTLKQLEFATGELRHAYINLLSGYVRQEHSVKFAQGLLGPQIRAIEASTEQVRNSLVDLPMDPFYVASHETSRRNKTG